MDDSKAKKLLTAERNRVERLLEDVDVAGVDDRTAADQEGEMYDSAEPLTTEGTDDAVRAELEERLAAVGRGAARRGWYVRHFGSQRAADTRRPSRSRSDR